MKNTMLSTVENSPEPGQIRNDMIGLIIWIPQDLQDQSFTDENRT